MKKHRTILIELADSVIDIRITEKDGNIITVKIGDKNRDKIKSFQIHNRILTEEEMYSLYKK